MLVLTWPAAWGAASPEAQAPQQQQAGKERQLHGEAVRLPRALFKRGCVVSGFKSNTKGKPWPETTPR